MPFDTGGSTRVIFYKRHRCIDGCHCMITRLDPRVSCGTHNISRMAYVMLSRGTFDTPGSIRVIWTVWHVLIHVCHCRVGWLWHMWILLCHVSQMTRLERHMSSAAAAHMTRLYPHAAFLPYNTLRFTCVILWHGRQWHLWIQTCHCETHDTCGT